MPVIIDSVVNAGIGVQLPDLATATVLPGLHVISTASCGIIGNSGQAPGDTYFQFENIFGSKQNDILTGDNSNDVLSAAAGNDWLHRRGGNDLLRGGSGADTLAGGSRGGQCGGQCRDPLPP